MGRRISLSFVLIFFAASILFITSGIRMSLGLFVHPLHHDIALNISAISFAIAVNQLVWGISQPVTGMLADRFSAWPVLFWGTILLALGCILVPFWTTSSGLVATIGVFIAFGAGAGSFSILISLVSQAVAPQQQGIASGIINAGGSFGQFVFAPFIQALIAYPFFGWQGAMFTLALVSLLILPMAYYLSKSSKPLKLPSNIINKNKELSLRQAIGQSLKNRSYLLLHLSFFTCGFHIALLVTHLPMEISLCGHSATVASSSLAIIGITNVIGSLVVGYLVQRYRSKSILFVMYALRALFLAIYLLLPSTALTFYIFAASLGLTWLATVPPTAALVGKLFGMRYLATLFGLTLLSHQIGGFLGAYLGGLVVENIGNYSWMWYLDITLALLAAISCLPIKEDKINRYKNEAKID